ncbi:MAG: hypothetical protein M1834_008812 [Cirrosporium novae-zelandiae]|nr:MAG: hypothetical protein M1834_008812 [Cirrosporium novae-zelandiae]
MFHITSSARAFPTNPINTTKCVPLSIIDATVANFAVSAAVWYYNSPSRPNLTLSPDHLKTALCHTLDYYPQWCGRLQWSAYKPGGLHTQRFHRLNLEFGKTTDPGIEFVVANYSGTLDTLVPNPEKRANTLHSWDATQVPSGIFLPTTPLAPSKNEDSILPCMAIQVTTFECGSLAVAVKLSHSLGDAITLSHFVKDWANISQAIFHKTPLPSPSPVFNPQLLDNAAAGDIDALEPNEQLVDIALALPCHRFDWWISGRDPPSELEPGTVLTLGTNMPWFEWDVHASVSHYLVHFDPLEMKHIHEAASMAVLPVSYQDALLSHIWACINRARELKADEEIVHLDVTFGLRPRTCPPLPKRFLGSPLMVTDVPATACEATTDSPAPIAGLIRSTLKKFDSSAIAAHLHTTAHEWCPQRLWQAFLGHRHVLVTSWVHTGMYEIDFGLGIPPRYVEAVMPSLDGCIQIMEAAPFGGSSTETKPRHWCDNGVDVSVHLESHAMERLLREPLLRKYSSKDI